MLLNEILGFGKDITKRHPVVNYDLSSHLDDAKVWSVISVKNNKVLISGKTKEEATNIANGKRFIDRYGKMKIVKST